MSILTDKMVAYYRKYLMIPALLAGIIAVPMACTERIEIELDSTYTRLVVYGEITSDTGVHTIRLSRTSDYYVNIPSPVSNAYVNISDGTDTFLLMENPEKKGLYETSDDFYGVPGKTYSLLIENVDIYGDGETQRYEAFTKMPMLSPMDSITLKYTDITFFSGWEVQVYTWDPAGTKDYYAFKVYKNGILLTDTLTKLIVQSDDLFNGNYTNGITAQFLRDNKPAERAIPGDTVTFELNAISRGFYEFVIELQNEVFPSSPLFSGPRANIKSNISNGALGFFHAYAIERKSILVPEISR
jgi:hypothetical protein